MLHLTLLAALAAFPRPMPHAVSPPPAVTAEPAPPAAQADAIVAAAFAPKESAAGVAPGSSGTSLGTLALPAVALAALAVAALILSRRSKARGPSRIRVLETLSVGPKRALVLAQLGDTQLLIGSSEGGLTLLSQQQTHAVYPEPATQPLPHTDFEINDDFDEGVTALHRRGQSGQSAGMAAAFERVMGEASEDDELRAKLASGMKVLVR